MFAGKDAASALAHAAALFAADELMAVRGRPLLGLPTTVRGSSVPGGRNAACPCGSGKKWKACCGSRAYRPPETAVKGTVTG